MSVASPAQGHGQRERRGVCAPPILIVIGQRELSMFALLCAPGGNPVDHDMKPFDPATTSTVRYSRIRWRGAPPAFGLRTGGVEKVCPRRAAAPLHEVDCQIEAGYQLQ